MRWVAWPRCVRVPPLACGDCLCRLCRCNLSSNTPLEGGAPKFLPRACRKSREGLQGLLCTAHGSVAQDRRPACSLGEVQLQDAMRMCACLMNACGLGAAAAGSLQEGRALRVQDSCLPACLPAMSALKIPSWSCPGRGDGASSMYSWSGRSTWGRPAGRPAVAERGTAATTNPGGVQGARAHAAPRTAAGTWQAPSPLTLRPHVPLCLVPCVPHRTATGGQRTCLRRWMPSRSGEAGHGCSRCSLWLCAALRACLVLERCREAGGGVSTRSV